MKFIFNIAYLKHFVVLTDEKIFPRFDLNLKINYNSYNRKLLLTKYKKQALFILTVLIITEG